MTDSEYNNDDYTEYDVPQPPVAQPEKKKGSRGPIYREEDDILLGKIFAEVSVDPIRGADRRGGEFWDQVVSEFNKRSAGEAVREKGPLGNHWSRVSKDITAFVNKLKSHHQSQHRISECG